MNFLPDLNDMNIQSWALLFPLNFAINVHISLTFTSLQTFLIFVSESSVN